MNRVIKKRLRSSGFRYILAAPLSALLAVLIPNFFIKVFDLNEDNAFYLTLLILLFINFIISCYFIFRQTTTLKTQFIKYTLAAIFFRWLDATWYKLYSHFVDLNYEVIIILSIGTTFILKYIVYKFLIFPNPRT